MNAAQLCFESGEKTGVWYCRTCGTVHRSEAAANDCCKPYICECGKELPRKEHRTRCDDCTRRKLAERTSKRLAEAELVENYDGWICSEEVTGNHDGYFASPGDLIEWCEDYSADEEEQLKVPEFAFCCIRKPFEIDAQRIIEIAESDCEQDLCDYAPHYVGEKEFDEACKRFSELNKDVCTWSVDYKRKVRVR